MTPVCPSYVRRKAVWGPKRIVWPILLMVLGWAPMASADGRHVRHVSSEEGGQPGSDVKQYQLDEELDRRSNDSKSSVKTSRVIVELVRGAKLPQEFKRFLRHVGNHGNTDDDHNLDILNAQVLELPNSVLKQLAKNPNVFWLHVDRPIKGHIYQTSVTLRALAVQQALGY